MLLEPRKGRVHRAPGESLRTIQTDASVEDNLSDVDIIMTALVSHLFSAHHSIGFASSMSMTGMSSLIS